LSALGRALIAGLKAEGEAEPRKAEKFFELGS
jgi:hypothetical protein